MTTYLIPMVTNAETLVLDIKWKHVKRICV